MNPKPLCLAVGILLFSLGCGGRPGAVTLGKSAVVLAFGDSLTAGIGAEPNESYPAVLQGLLGCRVINAGAPGEDTTAGLNRLKSTLESERVDLVILCEGGNDMLHNQSDEFVRNNLEAMVSLIKTQGVDVILLAVPRPIQPLKPPAFYREIAAAHTIPCEADALARILSSPALKSDPLHPNAKGYKRLAESVSSMINVTK
jgi:lysophospholipase L1-like esterase